MLKVFPSLSSIQSEERLDWLERVTAIPLLGLALLMIPLLLAPALLDLEEQERWFLAADAAIWAIFAIDYLAKLLVAPQRWAYVRSHPLELLIVVVPFLRVLRVISILRVLPLLRIAVVLRLFVVLGLNVHLLRALVLRRGTGILAAWLLIALVGGGSLVYLAEHDQPGNANNSIAGAIWGTLVTMTTVGYGGDEPQTLGGRVVMAVLMIFGIAAFSTLTARLAALMTVQEQQPRRAGSLRDLRIKRQRLRRL